ncbi:unnamed protein product, partial [Symbiodinium sp. CCMP2456]
GLSSRWLPADRLPKRGEGGSVGAFCHHQIRISTLLARWGRAWFCCRKRTAMARGAARGKRSSTIPGTVHGGSPRGKKDGRRSWDGWSGSTWHGTDTWQERSSRSSQESWASQEPVLSGYTRQALDGLGCHEGGTLQSAMIREFLRSESLGKVLARLDPARCHRAEQEYWRLIEEINITDLKYSHNNISRKFLHGDQEGLPVESLAHDLFAGRLQPTDVAALVGVRWQGKIFVICGNRRCKAMKLFAEWSASWGRQPKARVIVHDFPGLSGIEDPDVRWAFMLKATEAMSTLTGGESVQVGRRCRHR